MNINAGTANEEQEKFAFETLIADQARADGALGSGNVGLAEAFHKLNDL
jgi:hypothetical protein